METNSEIQFSSSVAKLLHHSHRLRHPLQPITLQIALTDRCNLDCDFCSVKNRAGDELETSQIFHILSDPVFGALKGVEITGGGEPTLHPDIDEIIKHIVLGRGLQAGLITNGMALMKKVSIDTMSLLAWIRVSLNGLDYLDDIKLTTRIPAEPILGFSYVVNERTTQDIINKVAQYATQYDAAYVRIVPNCFGEIADIPTDLSLDHPSFYIQTKTMQSLIPEAPCRMGYLKPYLNADGFFYWCSGVCLEKRLFPPEYRMGRWDDIARIWGDGQRAFTCDFPKCFWVEQNRLLKWLNGPITHKAFI